MKDDEQLLVELQADLAIMRKNIGRNCSAVFLLYHLSYDDLYVPIVASEPSILDGSPFSLFVAPLEIDFRKLPLAAGSRTTPDELIRCWFLLAAAVAKKRDVKTVTFKQRFCYLPDRTDIAIIAFSFDDTEFGEPNPDLVEMLSTNVARCLEKVQRTAEKTLREASGKEQLLEIVQAELTDKNHLPPYYPLTYVSVHIDDTHTDGFSFFTNPLGMSAWLRQQLRKQHEQPPVWVKDMPSKRKSNGSIFVSDLNDYPQDNLDALARLLITYTKDICVEVASVSNHKNNVFRYWVRFNVLRDHVETELHILQTITTQAAAPNHLLAFSAILEAINSLKSLEHCIAATVWVTEEDCDGKYEDAWYITAASGRDSLQVSTENLASMNTEGVVREMQAELVKCKYIPVHDRTDNQPLNALIAAANERRRKFDPITKLAEVLRGAFEEFTPTTAGGDAPDFPSGHHYPPGKARQILGDQEIRKVLMERASRRLNEVLVELQRDKMTPPTVVDSPELSRDEWMLLQTAKCFSHREIPLALLDRIAHLDNLSPELCFSVSQRELPEGTSIQDIHKRSSQLLFGLNELTRDASQPWTVKRARIYHYLEEGVVRDVLRRKRDMKTCIDSRAAANGAAQGNPGGTSTPPCYQAESVILEEPLCEIVLESRPGSTKTQLENLCNFIKCIGAVQGDAKDIPKTLHVGRISKAMAAIHQSGLVTSIVPGYDVAQDRLVLTFWIGLRQYNECNEE